MSANGVMHAVRRLNADPRPPAECKTCGSPFTPRGHQIYCSDDCRPWMNRSPLTGRRCAECDTPFTAKMGGQRYCGGPCRRRAWRRDNEAERERARERSRLKDRYRPAKDHPDGYEHIDNLTVFERDGWRCARCGKKVDKRLKHPHPRSASLDHVVPLALGGSHTYRNVQCAHLDCNMTKHHTGAGDQLALIG